MAENYTYIADLRQHARVPENGILSQTLQSDERSKIVLFGFAAGQELSAHTAPFKAAIHILEGSATVTLGSRTMDAAAGMWVMMEPKLEHGIKALTPVKALLTMLKQAQ